MILLRSLQLLAILFGLFLLYQAVRYLLGGSWNLDDVLLGFLFLDLTLVMTALIMLAKLSTHYGYLARDMRGMKKDVSLFMKKMDRHDADLTHLVKVLGKLDTRTA